MAGNGQDVMKAGRWTLRAGPGGNGLGYSPRPGPSLGHDTDHDRSKASLGRFKELDEHCCSLPCPKERCGDRSVYGKRHARTAMFRVDYVSDSLRVRQWLATIAEVGSSNKTRTRYKPEGKPRPDPMRVHGAAAEALGSGL
jgi:hypothetical protein